MRLFDFGSGCLRNIIALQLPVGLVNDTVLELALGTSRGVGQFLLPDVKMPREQQQDAYVRKMEIDPAKYYPPEVNRDLVLAMPTIKEILSEKVKDKVKQLKSKLTKGK